MSAPDPAPAPIVNKNQITSNDVQEETTINNAQELESGNNT